VGRSDLPKKRGKCKARPEAALWFTEWGDGIVVIIMKRGTVHTIVRWIALGALFLIPLTPLIVADALFFPFITGKAFYFRILAEIAVGAWAVLALMDKAYRPRFSWIGVTVVAFVAWMFLADALALNPLKAFWSNFERMEGWVLLVHLLGFFFAASTVLRGEKKWRAWFFVSLGTAVVVSSHALLQLAGVAPIHQGSTRIDASFGNSAYFAVYLLFNTFIAGWLALTEKHAWLKYLLFAFAILEGYLVFMTQTRGTVLGLIAGLILAAALAALTGGKRTRRIAAVSLMAIVVVTGGVYLARESSFVKHNSTLERVTSISVGDLQVRLTLWHMAFEGFLEKPVLGWGQEGFNHVFNKYYDPSLYQQEPWFDRAHNVFVDWLMAGGLPALVLYLSLFGLAVYSLWTNSTLSRAERIAITAALAGYAIHNLAVFDNLYSYVYFFAILALIDSQVGRPIARLEEAPEIEENDAGMYALPIVGIMVATLILMVNVSGMNASTKLITAISPSPDGTGNLAAFEDLTAHSPFAMQEVREQLVSFAVSAAGSSAVSADNKQKLLVLAITEMQKEVAAHPQDARIRLQLSYAYRAAGDSQKALEQVQAASALAPNKEQILIQQGILDWEAGDAQAARADFEKAYALGPQFQDLAAYAAAGQYGTGDAATAKATLNTAYGTTTVDSDILALAYYRTKDWQNLIQLWKLRISKNASGDTYFGLAAAYYVGGQKAHAIATVQEAVELFPELAPQAAAAISQIEKGQ